MKPDSVKCPHCGEFIRLDGLENLKWDPAAPGKDRTVITLGYSGDPAKNRGLEQAIDMLKAKYPDAEIVTRRVDATPGETLDAFHAKLGPVES